jgi:hypothetical protein
VSAVATTTTTSLAMNAPSGVAVGDTLIAAVACEAALQANTPSNWTLINYRVNSTSGIATTTFWRIADGTADDTPTITFGSTPTVLAKGTILRLSGAHASAPIDTFAVASDPGFATVATIATATVAENGSLAVGVGANLGNTVTWSAGWTERFDDATTTGLSVATQATNSGTSPTGTYTTSSSSRMVVTTIIVKPAATGGGNGLVYPQIIGSLIRPTPWSRFIAQTPIALLEAR